MIAVRRRRWLIVGSVCAVASACASSAPPEMPPLVGPAASARLRSFEGTPLSGPAPVPSSFDTEPEAADAWRVQVEWFVLRDVPRIGLDPLMQWARLIVANPDLQPRFAPAVLGRGAVLGRVPDAQAFTRALRERPGALRVAYQQGALPPGVTSAFELTAAGLTDQAGALPTRVALLLYRSANLERPLHTRLLPTDDGSARTLTAGAPRGDAASSDTTSRASLGGMSGVDLSTATTTTRPEGAVRDEHAPAQVGLDLEGRGLSGRDPCGTGPLRRELILVDEVLPPGAEGLVVALPSPFDHAAHTGSVWLLAVASIVPPPEPGEVSYAAHIEAFAATSAEVQRSRALVLPPLEQVRPAVKESALPNLEAVRQALQQVGEQRRALLELADATGAELTRDLALMGERADVDRLARSLSTRLGDRGAPSDPAGLRWLLERLAVDVLRDPIVARELSPGLATVLTRFAGAVADRPALLALVDAADDATHLEELLVRENASLLDDPAPSVRARAVAWLDARRPGLVPEGYDPLDRPRERRAALTSLRHELSVTPAPGEEGAGTQTPTGTEAPR